MYNSSWVVNPADVAVVGVPSDQEDRQPLLVNNPNVVGKHVSLDIRKAFVRKVYSILTAQLLMTSIIAAMLQSVSRKWIIDHMYIMYLSVVMTFVTVCTMGCCNARAKRFPVNYFLLFGFTAFEGVLVGFVSALFTWQSLTLAAGLTSTVFVALTLFAFHMETDFTGLHPYMYSMTFCIGVFGLCIAAISIIDVEIQWTTILYDFLGVSLFTCFMIFDTQLILGEWGGHRNQFGVDEYVFAALTLYLDILNISLFFVQLLGERRS